ncbi:hypothetical protein [uncultured Gimesia sp.]|jgi:hypothetical protein|uniref:hypothetical protein n=1 Tax=uncultured Gimesia sp. TaxID=1678688 RepID=UPI002614518A|nr:hypothetical protein [uncultured Gimesia sp.]
MPINQLMRQAGNVMSDNLSEKSYRPGPWYRSLFSIYTVFTLAFSVFLIREACSRGGDLTDGFVIVTLIYITCVIFMSTAGVWAFLTYSRWVRLILSEQTITKMEGDKEHVIAFNKISHLNWLSISDEMIVESPADTFRIDLDDFKRTDQRDIIAFLRNAVPLEKQEKWEPFSEVRRRSIDPDAPLTNWERLVTVVYLIATGLAVVMWWSESGMGNLMMAAIFLFAAIRSYRGT